jgi:2-keto-4-pentenoate hydratase/2-oxohepta-3-ene-1,7-dioic acid hydratase in catechol pathway
MKMLRYGRLGQDKAAILAADDQLRDLSAMVSDLAGESLLPESIEKFAKYWCLAFADCSGTASNRSLRGGRWRQVICIGLNYSDHPAELGMAVPSEPVIFMQATSAICGPNDDVVIPCGSKKMHWDELGVVIGKPIKYVEEADAYFSCRRLLR